MAPKLNEILKRNNNNFDLVRLVAALAVIFGHSFALFNTNGYSEPVHQFLKTDYSSGIALHTFFFLSGMFITASFINSKTRVRFLLMRLFRIWPALIVCVVLTVFLVGPLFSLYPVDMYFKTFTTWRYLKKNTILWFDVVYSLPGVFGNNHYPNVVNGSLWTLPLEIKCYCLVFFAGCIGLFKKAYYIIIAFSVFTILYVVNSAYFLKYVPSIFYGKEAIFFIIGSIAYNLRSYIVINYKIALALIIISLFLRQQGLFTPMFYITICYCVITVGAAPLVKKIHMPGDYSYGIYIYGFLIQQITASLYPGITSYISLLIVVPVTCFLAILSWHLIELPANKMAKKIADKYEYRVSKINSLYRATS